MLLYVDKKKQKRRMIKIVFYVLIGVFLLCTNIIWFHLSLHEAQNSLTAYHDIQEGIKQRQYSDNVYIFSAQTGIYPQVIVVPATLNRENVITISVAFSKLSADIKTVYFTSEVVERDYLLKLLRLYAFGVQLSDDKSAVIIATKLDDVKNIIESKALYPRVLNYSYTQKYIPSDDLVQLLEERFPLPQAPKNRLDKEKKALDSFAAKYQPELYAMVANDGEITFSARHFLLQRTGLCLGDDELVCNLEPKKSLQKSLQELLAKSTFKKIPQRLLLLTSLQEIETGDTIASDEGGVFRYGQREAVIFPWEKTESESVFADLKRKAGVNPNYDAKNMKFYKFKTTEVVLNDKI